MAERAGPYELRAHLGELLKALGALHAEEVPHGALCPEHVLLEGGVRLADLGPCPAAYLAPERGAPSLRADVFAVGVIFHELLTGALPTPGGRPPSAHDRTRLHPAFDAVVARCLEADPARRYPRAQAVAHELELVTAALDARARAARAAATPARANQLLASVMRGELGFLPD